MYVDAIEAVKVFLRAQNLEQLGRVDEALDLYETVIAGGFDSIGPYDRLISIYSNRALHRDVVRVTELALEHVHTYSQKLEWYEQMKAAAESAVANVPRAIPKNSS
jgi:hypothetical protein